MVTADLTLGGEHTARYMYDTLLDGRYPETYMILLTNVTPIKSIKKFFNLLMGSK